jgi:calcium-dependent protein kinase
MDQELKVLEEVDHPHITRVFALLEDSVHYFVVMEAVSGGNLLERVCKLKKFNEFKAASIAKQIMLALNYMHTKNIAHRDLKPENILCQSADPEDTRVKLTDFGFSIFLNPEKKASLALGSPLYMAPELVREESYDKGVDVWALGCIVYILLTGTPPYIGKTKEEIYWNIDRKNVRYDPKHWSRISQEGEDFVKACLTRNQNDRPSVDVLLEHPWINRFVETPDVSYETKLDVASNLANFRKTSLLQSTVMGLIGGLLTTAEELEELKIAFLEMD